MNLLNKLTIKNLKLNKKRTIVTIIGIMLSVALITAVASVYTSGIKSLIKYEAKEMGNFHVEYKNVPTDVLTTISNNKAVEDFYLVRNIGYAKIDSKNEYKPYIYVKSFNEKALKELSINLIEGEMPKNSNEIVIPNHLKTNGRVTINVGDEITLNIGKRIIDGYELNQYNPYTDEEKLVDTKAYKYKVVGIMERPANNIENFSAPGYTFVTYDDSIQNGTYDVYTKYTKDGLKHIYEVTGNILGVDGEEFDKCFRDDAMYDDRDLYDKCEELVKNTKYETEINQYLIMLQTDPIGSEAVGGLDKIAIVVCLIIVFTSVFCIKNSFDISITEKIKQYGMLKSVGATHKQIKKNVFFEATILGLFGIPLGLLLGFLASFILMIVSNIFVKDMLSVTLSFSFSWLAVIVAIVLGIATIYLSALSSARKASKVSPIDSIRNAANIKINSKKIKSPKFIRKTFGIGGDISYKNLKRNKKKYRTTVISIIVSVFVFIALSSFMDIIFRSIKEDFKTTEYNLGVYISESDKHKFSDITKSIDEFISYDSVKEYTVSKNNSLEIKDPKITEQEKENNFAHTDIRIMTLSDQQYRKYIKSLGLKYEEIKDKAILMDTVKNIYASDEKPYRKYTYNVGDIITGEVDNKNYDIKIGYVTDIKPFGYQASNLDYYMVISDEMFDNEFSVTSYDIYLKTTEADKMQDTSDKLFKDYEVETQNVDKNYKMINNLYTLVAIFLYGFIIVISLIGITNIFNTITTNMTLRKREFATLKSVGMTKKEFNRMIRLESLFMGVKSLFYGIVIGVLLSYLVFIGISQSLLTYHIPYKGIMISIVIVFMLIGLIMKYSINKINKQNIIETIRNENI